jgi:TolB-like protein/tRNA A-37 threonylcarbamoyl transferase component Bud32
MNHAAVSPPEVKVTACARCGAIMRLETGVCVSCLLREGLETGVSRAAFETVMAEVDVPDKEWRLGNYEVLDEIGRGGMSVIYRARQRHSRRIVAVKRMLSYQAESHETLMRFRREAEAVASLDHPNILPIYEVSESDEGLPFFTMKFASGGSLHDAAPSLRNETRTCVHLMAKVARAIEYAHGKGILHRDLKPGNILLDERGEPLVSDFGLAKWLHADSDLTKSLTTFGTAGYIAPEQAEGAAADLTPAADVYSLGAILFKLLAGRPPFLGANPLSVIRQASETPAPKLRSLAQSHDRDLETICARCLERDPKARYQSAGDLATDLERWLKGLPIVARPVSVATRIWRWSRRNPKLVGTGVAGVLLGAAAIFAASVFFIFPSTQTARRAVATVDDSGAIPVPEKSIAVLPFENLSNDKEGALFADGVHDDILTKLAKIADLKVISRTSVMQFRPAAAGRNMRQIGDALRVSHVLEGSVRKTGAQLQINAQLIDTRSDTHVWAEKYDRYLSDVFAIQSEIARKVAEQLDAKISASEKLALARPPTANLAAFDLYIHAKNLLLTVSSSIKAKPNLLEAVDLLNDAVARDPAFFQAYCQLARTHLQFYFLGHDRTPARLALAEAAVQAAFRLRPDAGEAHLARAESLYRGHLDYDGALAELEIARQTLPNEPRIFELKGYIERRRPGGNQEEALRNFERAIELDPRNFFILQQAAMSYDLLRRYADEAAALDRALAIVPNDAETKVWRAALEMDWKADTGPLHQVIDELRAKDPAAIQSVADMWLACALAERDAAAAADALAALGENSFGNETVRFSPRFVEGLIARMTKDDTKARAAFAAARVEQEKIVQAQPNYAPPLCVLGLIDAGLGRKEEALREGRRAVQLLPVEKDALNGTRMIEYLAQIAAWVGEKDLACEQLAIALRSPRTFLNYGKLKLSPFWDPLRGEPCFEELVASVAPKDTHVTR